MKIRPGLPSGFRDAFKNHTPFFSFTQLLDVKHNLTLIGSTLKLQLTQISITFAFEKFTRHSNRHISSTFLFQVGKPPGKGNKLYFIFVRKLACYPQHFFPPSKLCHPSSPFPIAHSLCEEQHLQYKAEINIAYCKSAVEGVPCRQ